MKGGEEAMYTKSKKLLATICMGAMVLTSVPAVAMATTADNSVNQQENELMPCMTYIQRTGCTLVISGTTAKINCSLTGISSSTKAKIIAELQVKNGTNWIPVKIWTETQDGDEISVDESYSVTKGNTYRVKATVTVWEGSQSETQNLYSSEKTA